MLGGRRVLSRRFCPAIFRLSYSSNAALQVLSFNDKSMVPDQQLSEIKNDIFKDGNRLALYVQLHRFVLFSNVPGLLPAVREAGVVLELCPRHPRHPTKGPRNDGIPSFRKSCARPRGFGGVQGPKRRLIIRSPPINILE